MNIKHLLKFGLMGLAGMAFFSSCNNDDEDTGPSTCYVETSLRNGNLQSQYVFKNGRLHSDHNGGNTVYEYNDQGRVELARTSFDTTEYEYNNQGYVEEETNINNGNRTTTTYEYDDQNNIEKREIGTTSYYEYEYENGKKVETKYYVNTGNGFELQYTRTYEYEGDKVIETERTDDDGTVDDRQTWTYEGSRLVKYEDYDYDFFNSALEKDQEAEYSYENSAKQAERFNPFKDNYPDSYSSDNERGENRIPTEEEWTNFSSSGNTITTIEREIVEQSNGYATLVNEERTGSSTTEATLEHFLYCR